LGTVSRFDTGADFRAIGELGGSSICREIAEELFCGGRNLPDGFLERFPIPAGWGAEAGQLPHVLQRRRANLL
jgi:hypothetical protein